MSRNGTELSYVYTRTSDPIYKLLQETTFAGSALRHFVVSRVIESQKFPRKRAQARLHFGADELLLVLLLGLIAPSEIHMHGAAGKTGSVIRPAMPHMGVHHDHGTSFSRDQNFTWNLRSGF